MQIEKKQSQSITPFLSLPEKQINNQNFLKKNFCNKDTFCKKGRIVFAGSKNDDNKSVFKVRRYLAGAIIGISYLLSACTININSKIQQQMINPTIQEQTINPDSKEQVENSKQSSQTQEKKEEACIEENSNIASGEWNDNVSVLASGSQKDVSWYKRPIASNLPLWFYTSALTSNLMKNTFKSLHEANSDLLSKELKEVEFFEKKAQIPVQSSNKLDSWKKGDNKPVRYVLLMADHSIEKETTENTINLMSQTIRDKKIFNVPEENIKMVKETDATKFKEGINWITEKAKEVNSGKNVEILIYYAGHGEKPKIYCKDKNTVNENKEGSREGLFRIGITEKEFKSMINNINKDAKIAVILDSCFSGAFVAQNNQENSSEIA